MSRPDDFTPPPKRAPALQDTKKRTVYLGDHLYEEVNKEELKRMIAATTRIHKARGLPTPEFKKLSSRDKDEGCKIPVVNP
jgi:hypothetical protein